MSWIFVWSFDGNCVVFELEKINKFVVVYRDAFFVRKLSFFMLLKIQIIFLQNFYRTFRMFIYTPPIQCINFESSNPAFQMQSLPLMDAIRWSKILGFAATVASTFSTWFQKHRCSFTSQRGCSFSLVMHRNLAAKWRPICRWMGLFHVHLII
jgi:hypothetical protein